MIVLRSHLSQDLGATIEGATQDLGATTRPAMIRKLQGPAWTQPLIVDPEPHEHEQPVQQTKKQRPEMPLEDSLIAMGPRPSGYRDRQVLHRSL